LCVYVVLFLLFVCLCCAVSVICVSMLCCFCYLCLCVVLFLLLATWQLTQHIMHRNFIIIIIIIINITVVFQLHFMHCVMKLQPSNNTMFQRLTVSPFSRKIGKPH